MDKEDADKDGVVTWEEFSGKLCGCDPLHPVLELF
jgi:hypothetical protein